MKQEKMRKNLKIFRVFINLTQDEIAKKIGYSTAEYNYIETGKRNPHEVFWNELQKVFRLRNEDIEAFKRNE